MSTLAIIGIIIGGLVVVSLLIQVGVAAGRQAERTERRMFGG